MSCIVAEVKLSGCLAQGDRERRVIEAEDEKSMQSWTRKAVTKLPGLLNLAPPFLSCFKLKGHPIGK